MKDKIIGTIKQPSESTRKRGIVFLVFSMLLVLYMIFKNEEFIKILNTTYFALLLPVSCGLFFIIGILLIVIVYMNRDLKEMQLKVENGKLIIHSQIPFTPIFLINKTIVLDYPVKEASLLMGNLKGSVNKWWKLCLNDGSKTVAVTIVKSNFSDAEKIVNTINKKEI
jgi:hypothetical protein